MDGSATVSGFVEDLREELVAAAEREQERRLPRLERPGPRLVLATAAAASMVLILLLASGGMREQSPRTSRPGAQPTPEGRDLFGGTLQPGEQYRTTAFVPALSFEVKDGEWYVGDTSASDLLELERRTPRPEPGAEWRTLGFLSFQRITEIYRPEVEGRTASSAAAPADLHAWLRRHPDLRVGPASETTVAGVPGEQFDVEVRFDRPEHSDPDCRRALLRTCALVWAGRSFLNGTRLRAIILRTEPTPLVVTMLGWNARDLDTVVKDSAPVLESLRIGVR
jgi:hypothetical protein